MNFGSHIYIEPAIHIERMNLGLRNSLEDGSQRMLNAIEPGSPMPVHRHRHSSETVVCLRGRLVEEFYDDLENQCTASIELTPGALMLLLSSPLASGTPLGR